MKPEQYINFARMTRAYNVPDDDKIFICAFGTDNVHNAELTIDMVTARYLVQQLQHCIEKNSDS